PLTVNRFESDSAWIAGLNRDGVAAFAVSRVVATPPTSRIPTPFAFGRDLERDRGLALVDLVQELRRHHVVDLERLRDDLRLEQAREHALELRLVEPHDA